MSDAARENTSRNTHNVVAGLLFAEQGVKRVLDLPCGEGAFTRRLVERGIEAHAGDCARQGTIPGASFEVCDMNGPLPFEKGFFDAVVCIDGIEHIERPFDFMRECHRIVRPGGLLLLSTPNISALRSRWRWFLTGFHNKCKRPLNEGSPSPLNHISMVSFPELRYRLHAGGFHIRSVAANRTKLISWIYAPAVPPAWLVTAGVLRREEKDAEQRGRNREILRQMFSKAVLFGETLIVEAERANRCRPGRQELL
jgi:SAM-dependent methyltransferase